MSLGGDHNPYKSEEELVKCIKEKDSKVLPYLYTTYGPSLYGMLYRMLGDHNKAEELLVLTFVKLFEDIHFFDAKKRSFFTHMMSIVRNVVKEHRSHKENRHSQHDMNQSDIAAVDKQRGHEPFADLLSKLPSEQEEVFRMLFIQGYSYAEVARKKNSALGKVRSLVRTAMVKVRELLQRKA